MCCSLLHSKSGTVKSGAKNKIYAAKLYWYLWNPKGINIVIFFYITNSAFSIEIKVRVEKWRPNVMPHIVQGNVWEICSSVDYELQLPGSEDWQDGNFGPRTKYFEH